MKNQAKKQTWTPQRTAALKRKLINALVSQGFVVVDEKKNKKKKKKEKRKKKPLYKLLYKPVEKIHLAGVSYYLLYVLPKGKKKPAGPYWYAYFRRNGRVIRKFDARMIVDEELFEFVYNLAKKENIPIQIAVSGGSTDASISETSYIGYKSIPICFPVRYTHSTVEISSLKDGENLIKLLNVLINYEL
jgi:hypothetical protein